MSHPPFGGGVQPSKWIRPVTPKTHPCHGKVSLSFPLPLRYFWARFSVWWLLPGTTVVHGGNIRGERVFHLTVQGIFSRQKFLLHFRLQRCILNEILDGLFVIFDSSNVARGLDFCLDSDYEKIVAYGREYYVVFFSLSAGGDVDDIPLSAWRDFCFNCCQRKLLCVACN